MKKTNPQVVELENNCLIFGIFLAQTNDKLNRKTEALKMVGKDAINDRADSEAADDQTYS